jgi:hypothetical protein
VDGVTPEDDRRVMDEDDARPVDAPGSEVVGDVVALVSDLESKSYGDGAMVVAG